MTFLLRAGALGLATGSRSAMGLAALALTARDPRSSRWPESLLGNPWATRAALAASAAELVGDQFPRTPSRLEPGGLIPRLVLGGLGAAVLGHRERQPARTVLIAGALGSAMAAIGAFGGAGWRRHAATRFGQDRPGALIEDAAAIAVATLATRPVPARRRSRAA